jgi:rRNA maturation endonuclease Nob1
MIVNPLNLFAWALVAALTAILLAAAFYDWIVFRRRKKKTKAIYRCTHCRAIYEERRRTPLARCPKCGHPNEPSGE